MILELNGTKVTIVDKTLGYQGDNLVNTIQVTVDKDSTWNYKLDMYKGKSKCFDSVLMTRDGNVCTVQLTNEILSYGGRYIFQLRGYTDTQTYHSDIFESWVNASIEYQGDCKQACGCDCKLPTEFYQVEDNVTEINNHPPYPGDNGKWMIWDVDKHEYVESDIEVIGGDDYQTKANLTTSITQASTDEQYPSAKATYDYGQSIKTDLSTSIADAKQAGTDAQTNLTAHINDKENPHEVTKEQVGLGNVDNTSDENKPVSTLQATAIADAKKAGTDAQANLTAHIDNKENPHSVTKVQVGLGNVDNTSDANKPISTAAQTAIDKKLDKTAVVDVTADATKGQAADAKSVYDTIQALPTGTDISLGITSAAVGDIVKVKAVDASGKPTEWEAAELEKPWTKIIDLEITEETATIEKTGLDNCTEFVIFWNGLLNASTLDSGLNIRINGTEIASNTPVPSRKADGTPYYGYTMMKHNGIFWQLYRGSGATDSTKVAMSSNMAYIPCNLVRNVSAATTLLFTAPRVIYAPVSGGLEVWAR